jgi:hypothetical protein
MEAHRSTDELAGDTESVCTPGNGRSAFKYGADGAVRAVQVEPPFTERRSFDAVRMYIVSSLLGSTANAKPPLVTESRFPGYFSVAVNVVPPSVLIW